MLADLASSFTIGLLAPLTAVCVLPLYPGFLSYLSSQLDGETDRRTYAMFGFIAVAGVMTFMMSLGLVFSTLLEYSLTSVVQVVSPLAFGLLGLVSLALIFGLDFRRYLPDYTGPRFENPLANAFGFGFFFGAIILPCNPAFIAAFFARALLFDSPAVSFLNFVSFGLGIGFPLLAFSIVSSRRNRAVINLLTRHESLINRGSGVVMLAVSIYYLVFVFDILPI